MKKISAIICLLGLTACQAPYNRNVYQATGPRVCVEYYDSFRCSTPMRMWNETVYPKNNIQMQYGNSIYAQPNMSQVVYGTL